ncbi:MAG: hypothetical protein JW993_08490 [Sedimentisphaerales bacterium]|nr:hypothetical protein [Sedimentisphaerales bacterium]
MKPRQYVLRVAILALIVGSAPGVTVTLTDDDSCTAMGALADDDADGYSVVLTGHGGAAAKPYISTPFPGGGTYAHTRRAIAEFSLMPMRRIAHEPNAVRSAVLRFYFDDVIFPGSSLEPWTTQDFTLELYTDTAGGSVEGLDVDGLVADTQTGDSSDGWASEPVETWHFVAGATGPYPAGRTIVGMYGPDEPYPAAFGDDELMIYGMIGFEVDVTQRLIAALADPNVSHVGFRWISNTPDGYWTSMDPEGYLPALSVDMQADAPLTFVLTSSDIGPVTGDQHSGRAYHIFNGPHDEAVYLTAREWTGSHSPQLNVVWPIPDGIIEWDVFTDPNRMSERPEAVTYDAAGNPLYVYWDVAEEDFVLVADENDVPETVAKVYYEQWSSDLPLSLGNYGPVPGTTSDVQHALLTEFKMERPSWYGLDPNALTRAYIELTIDRVVDMSLSGNNMALPPSLLYVNGFAGDGIVGRFENAQADFERIDHVNADATAWLTIDGSPEGTPITDFSLSWHKLVDPGQSEPLTLHIDVTESVRERLAAGVDFAGFVLSCSSDGDFCLASIDLVDDVRGTAYLPALVLETTLQ